MESRIVNTEELVRITFDDGYFERLMMQTYTNDRPFYYVTKGLNFTRVETADTDLQKVIKQLEFEAGLDEMALNADHVKNNENVFRIHEKVLANKLKFIADIKMIVAQKFAC